MAYVGFYWFNVKIKLSKDIDFVSLIHELITEAATEGVL